MILGAQSLVGAFLMTVVERTWEFGMLDALVQVPLVVLAGTLLAVLVPGLRVRRMRPVEALREEE